MSVDKLVDSTQLDADLTSVANAIRTKGGTSASLAFPAEFVAAVAAIPTGSSIQTGTAVGDGTAIMTIPVSGTVSTIIVYTEDYSGGADYNNVECLAISGIGVWGNALGSQIRPNRAIYMKESDYSATRYVNFNSGNVVLRPQSTGSGNQKWISGVTYHWIAF